MYSSRISTLKLGYLMHRNETLPITKLRGFVFNENNNRTKTESWGMSNKSLQRSKFNKFGSFGNDNVALHYVNLMAYEAKQPLSLHNGSATRQLSMIKPCELKSINNFNKFTPFTKWSTYTVFARSFCL